MQKGIKIFLKTIGWILLSILLIVLILFFAIQIPGVQNFAKNKAVSFLKDKTKTEISIGHFRLKLFNSVELGEVYVEDLRKDTLLYAERLEVHLNMLDLLSSNANVKSLELQNAYVDMHRRSPDTVFNFQFIIDAFAPANPVEKDSAVADFAARVKELVFDNVRLNYADDVVGSSFSLNSGYLQTELEKFDLRTLTTIFGDIKLEDTHAKIHMYQPKVFLKSANILATGTQETETSALPLGLGDIDFKRVSVDYIDELVPMNLNFGLRTLAASPKEVDLSKMHFHLSSVLLDSARTNIAIGLKSKKKADIQSTADTDTASVSQWKFLFDKVAITNNHFSYNDSNVAKTRRGVDYSHLDVKDFNLHASAIDLAPVDFKGSIDSLSLREQSGFILTNAHTRFAHNNKFTSLGNLLLQTPRTVIRDSVYLGYNSLDDLGRNPGNTFIDARLINNRIAVNDILLLVPDLESQLGEYSNSVVRVNSRVKGYLKDLDIPTLEVSGIGNTELKISGNIKGLPNAENAYFDIDIDKLVTTRNDILNFLPPGTIPPNTLRIPNNISANGTLRGNLKDITTQLNLRTSNGNANINAAVNENGRYTANITTSALDIGYLLYQEKNVGKVSANIRATGSGLNLTNFNLNRLYSNFSGKVSSARVMEYTYSNFDIDGTLSRGVVTSVANIADENIAFHLNSVIDLNGSSPAIQADMILDTINVHALGFMNSFLGAKTKLKADFTNINPDYLSGTLVIQDLMYRTDSSSGAFDSLVVRAINEGEFNQLYVTLDSAARINMRGNYKLTQLPAALMSTINNYYSLPDYTPKPFSPQQLELDGVIIPTGSLVAMVPAIRGSDTLAFNGSYTSANNFIEFNANSNKIKYNKNDISNLNIALLTENDSIKLAANVDNIFMEALRLYKTALNASVSNDVLVFDAQSNDTEDKKWYALGGQVTTENNGYNLSLKPEGLVLDYEEWTVAPDNLLRYSSTEGVYARNFVISKNDQSLSLNSENTMPNAPLNAAFNNFKISTITNIANQTQLPLEGTINGTAQVRDMMKQPLFVSNLKIDDIAYANDTIGNLLIDVNNNKAPNIYSANIVLSGQGNDASVTGDFFAEGQRLDLLFDARRLMLETVKPFAGEQLTDIGGYATARVDITGTASSPQANGYINFDTAYVIPFVTGEKLTFNNHRILVEGQGLYLINFRLTDTRGNNLEVDGDIVSSNFSNFNFDLYIVADDFQAVNAEAADKRIFFGTLNLDVDMMLVGDVQSPFLRGNLRVNENTDFSMLMPSGDPEIEEREGVVIFVEKDRQEEYIRQLIARQDSLTENTNFKGMDVFVNIETDSAAQLSLVIDPRTSDALTLKGLASLDFGIDRSGKMSMTGSYVLSHGYYNLSFAFMKKRFEIEPGSTIIWTGDPLTANVDLLATHPVSAAPIDLIAQQSTNIEPKYNQLLPFDVHLNVSGELMKPEVSFDIILPEETSAQWPLVDTKLSELRSNVSEMNKQVFALMLLGRFVGPNPLESAGPAMNIGNMAKQSVSNLLTQELNKLADGLVKDFDLNFGLTTGTDYITGEAIDRTDLSVGVSKQLLNDRLNISVGSNFALGGTAANQAATNIAGDVTIDYKLTDDGKYRIRAYRRNIYEGVIEGQVVRTGIAFALTMDYDRFSEIFSRPENKKFFRRIRKEQNKEQKKIETERQFELDQRKVEQGL